MAELEFRIDTVCRQRGECRGCSKAEIEAKAQTVGIQAVQQSHRRRDVGAVAVELSCASYSEEEKKCEQEARGTLYNTDGSHISRFVAPGDGEIYILANNE